MKQSGRIYRDVARRSLKETNFRERKLTPQQILYLRYQCAKENKDFETANILESVLAQHQSHPKGSERKKPGVLKAKQKAEQLFEKRTR